jgi:hypothetical protein
MSINNLENVTASNDNFYKAEKTDVSFFDDNPPINNMSQEYHGFVPSKTDYALRPDFFIPLNIVKNSILQTYSFIAETKSDLELLLKNVFLDPSINPNIEEAHKKIWEEIKKYNQVEDAAPEYISFSEYLYAERSMSTSCIRLLEECRRAISQSSFSYLYDLRSLLAYMLNEAICIKDILLYKFGEDYEDDSQKQVATEFDAWSRIASQFTQRIKETIISPPGQIPITELDKITKKQAVEFQAFFSIRLNAIHEEIGNILHSLKRDYVDNCDIFYERYLSQALEFKKDIVTSMEVDFYTTSLPRELPFLTDELLIATNVINANFGMVLSDLVQRNEIIDSNADRLFKLVQVKRKYSNYIFQLSFKGQVKPIIIKSVNEDKYSSIFDSAIYTYRDESDLISNHASLDNLLEDHHPQYLLKNGGIITGDIFVDSNAKIDGVQIATHSHSGFDGSEKIKASDIDYSSSKSDSSVKPNKPSSLSVLQYVTDIVDGGVPVIDAIIDIEVEDSLIDQSHEIIIQVIEI